jgi:hypothetical protein
MRSACWTRLAPTALGACMVLAPGASATDPQPRPTLTIRRAAGAIRIDGDLSDPGWVGIEPVTTWYETNPGDNVPAGLRNAGYLAYDDEALYAAFDLEDPQPSQIRAPFGDHDQLPGSTDYAGVIVDSDHDGKSAMMFLANPRGVQYDAVTNDATGEDSSPDFHWSAAGRVGKTGWTLELRIPFSSLRYDQREPQLWGILLYRNYPRDRRVQHFSAMLPRDVSCFICNSNLLTGLEHLPHGAHWVAAPYLSAAQNAAPGGGLGTPLENENADADIGVDFKWTPTADTVIDATINPDFSQIESDVAQISANERFALFFPEKRPFFLEASDLLQTPIQAAYTRTVTSPRGGLRATGRHGKTAYTILTTEDRGGGLVILPGSLSSSFAPQDFTSRALLSRIKRDIGSSHVAFLATGRDVEEGGNNWVLGPDFQWRTGKSDTLTGQLLFSGSETPERPDLATEWDGRSLSGHAAETSYSHGTDALDLFLLGREISEAFRADNGFVPQVGYRRGYVEAGHTFRPNGFFSRVRVFTYHDYSSDLEDDATLTRLHGLGFGSDGRWGSFLRFELRNEETRVGTALLERFRPRLTLTASPGQVVNEIALVVNAGEDIDFDNARVGHGADIALSGSLRPLDRLELRINANRRWLDVAGGRLFTADISRLRAQWSFTTRSFLRVIGQYVETERDPLLYTFAVAPKDASFSGSALFAYKLNWQSVLFAGYGDEREYDQTTLGLEPASRQFFIKLSYAFRG